MGVSVGVVVGVSVGVCFGRGRPRAKTWKAEKGDCFCLAKQLSFFLDIRAGL